MKLRVISLIVGLVYALLALPGLLEHHHQADGEHQGGSDCPACVWQANAATDLPLTISVPACPSRLVTVLAPKAVFPPAIFALATASRAPPEALV